MKKYEENPENDLQGKMGKNIFDKLEIEIDEKNDIELQQQTGQEQEGSKDRKSKTKESPELKAKKKDQMSLDLGLISGYLCKKKFQGYKRKYYMIREEKLYWSKNESNICETKKVMEIKTLKKCYPIKERGFILVRNTLLEI